MTVKFSVHGVDGPGEGDDLKAAGDIVKYGISETLSKTDGTLKEYPCADEIADQQQNQNAYGGAYPQH